MSLSPWEGNTSDTYQMTVDLNILEHFGINLYSNVAILISAWVRGRVDQSGLMLASKRRRGARLIAKELRMGLQQTTRVGYWCFHCVGFAAWIPTESYSQTCVWRWLGCPNGDSEQLGGASITRSSSGPRWRSGGPRYFRPI